MTMTRSRKKMLLSILYGAIAAITVTVLCLAFITKSVFPDFKRIDRSLCLGKTEISVDDNDANRTKIINEFYDVLGNSFKVSYLSAIFSGQINPDYDVSQATSKTCSNSDSSIRLTFKTEQTFSQKYNGNVPVKFRAIFFEVSASTETSTTSIYFLENANDTTPTYQITVSGNTATLYELVQNYKAN